MGLCATGGEPFTPTRRTAMTTTSESATTIASGGARRYYRVKDAARVLSVPVRTLYHLVETEQIPCRRLGSVILIPASWVDHEPTAPRRH